VCDVPFPDLDVTQAWFDPARRCIALTTRAGRSDRRGAPCTLRVTKLPDPRRVQIVDGGQPYSHWRITGTDEITVDTAIEDRGFLIFV
jgi:hypothetical protein